MKNETLTAIICFFAFLGSVNAQNADELTYVDAHELMLLGQGFEKTQVEFGRLPAEMKFRKELTSLGTNSAGLALRFSSNSRTIAFKWTLRDKRQARLFHRPSHCPNRCRSSGH